MTRIHQVWDGQFDEVLVLVHLPLRWWKYVNMLKSDAKLIIWSFCMVKISCRKCRHTKGVVTTELRIIRLTLELRLRLQTAPDSRSSHKNRDSSQDAGRVSLDNWDRLSIYLPTYLSIILSYPILSNYIYIIEQALMEWAQVISTRDLAKWHWSQQGSMKWGDVSRMWAGCEVPALCHVLLLVTTRDSAPNSDSKTKPWESWFFRYNQ